MTLQEFNFIHDAFVDRGNLDGAFLLEELYPELLERSIDVFFEEMKDSFISMSVQEVIGVKRPCVPDCKKIFISTKEC